MTANIEQLRALAERLEKATEGCFQINRGLAVAMGWTYTIHPGFGGAGPGQVTRNEHGERDTIRDWSQSTEAALGLVARLLPEWKWQVGYAFHHDSVVGWLAPPQASDWSSSLCFAESAKTAPLAILRALVSALLTQAEPAQ
jgi:hypothetical protein